MPFIQIIVKEKDDKVPARSDVKNPLFVDLETFIILENGMESGKTSVCLVFTDGNGQRYFAETSAIIYDAMASALAGAEMRFAAKKARNN